MGVFRPARPHTAITTLSWDSVCIDAGMAVTLCVSLISAKVLKCVQMSTKRLMLVIILVGEERVCNE